jgi:hypothetical protein
MNGLGQGTQEKTTMKRPVFAGANGSTRGTADESSGESFLSGVRATLALWWLAAKRNGGVLLLPVVAGVMWWLVRDSHSYRGVVLWMPTVRGIGYTLGVAGPLTAALASWVAGRSRRRRMTDLLATAPLPSGWSVVAEWLAVTFWALAAYLGCAAVALAWTATGTTWGGPLLSPILVAAVALAVCAAGGLLLGSLWPSRFLPPLLAIAVAFLIVGPTGMWQLERFKMLSPMGPIDSVVRYDPMIRVDERMMRPHLLWLAALSLTLVLGLVVRQRGGWAARALLVASVAAAVITATPLLNYRSQSWGEFTHAAIPYEPICATETVTVCVHPAYEEFLGEVAASVELIVAPLAGIEGVPTRFEQTVFGDRSSDVVYMYIYGADSLSLNLGHEVSRELVTDWEAMEQNAESGYGGYTAAQAIVAEWLRQDYQQRAGLRDEPTFYGPMPGAENSLVLAEMVVEGEQFHCVSREDGPQPMICDYHYDYDAAAGLQAQIDAATERFLALDPATRRAWLNANWTELRAGLLTLEDMP